MWTNYHHCLFRHILTPNLLAQSLLTVFCDHLYTVGFQKCPVFLGCGKDKVIFSSLIYFCLYGQIHFELNEKPKESQYA